MGKGVFGLSRAFILAGANILVMSLWKVPDPATAILIEQFYTNLLKRKLSRSEALRESGIHSSLSQPLTKGIWINRVIIIEKILRYWYQKIIWMVLQIKLRIVKVL